MKKHLLIALLFFTSLQLSAQILFEPGYFLDNSGKRTACLIKNLDWLNNPDKFTYKLSADAAVKTATLADISEFGIDNVSKYKRFLVDIDRSTDDLALMGSSSKPEFKTEQLFLKVLVEGAATLYFFEDATVVRYFYGTSDASAEQLIYKKYKTADFNVAENNTFKSQLAKLKCAAVSENDVNNQAYDKTLKAFFIKYNSCTNQPFVTYNRKSNHAGGFHLAIRPGVNASSLSTTLNRLPNGRVDNGSKVGARLGIEAEYVLPFNKNKWAIIFEPTYQYYKSDFTVNNIAVSSDYKSIELPLGVRHYLFLNNDAKIFLNALFVYDLPFSSIVKPGSGFVLDVNSRPTLAFGAGYKFKDRFSGELRYMLPREILNDNPGWNSSYKTIALVFGYRIF